jgi:hypothetical protein
LAKVKQEYLEDIEEDFYAEDYNFKCNVKKIKNRVQASKKNVIKLKDKESIKRYY